MEKLFVSSSSFILPKNPAWDRINKNFNLNFKYADNYYNLLLSNENDSTLLCILFLKDFYDDKIIFEINEKKIDKINSGILKLIQKKIKTAKKPLIIALSSHFDSNIIETAFKNSLSEKIHSNFKKNFQKLQKKNRNLYLLDLNITFSNEGYKNIFDKRNYYLANCRLSMHGLEILVESLNSFLERIKNPPKKLLILDCDNTLWGGVVGEDGISSLQLGQDGIGRAFLDFQKTIKNLSKKGYLLAISSKNNEKDVLEVFNKHQFMQIKTEDIVNFKINWREKSHNIIQMSKELDLGLDSMVFWDDNPFERAKMRKKIPEISTVEPNEDITYWSDQLKDLMEFSKFDVTKEDLKKTHQYKMRSKFIENKKTSSSEYEFLRSIELKAKNFYLNKSNISRASQMTQKTNQFNLRTKRYSESEIHKISKNKKNMIFLTQLEDIYGDHGIVGLLIVKELSKENLFIDTFLMSCRILGRSMETWMMAQLKNYAKKKKYKYILGEYIPSEKNQICSKFLKDHNFKLNKKVLKNKKIQSYYAVLNKINVSKSDVYN